MLLTWVEITDVKLGVEGLVEPAKVEIEVVIIVDIALVELVIDVVNGPVIVTGVVCVEEEEVSFVVVQAGVVVKTHLMEKIDLE